jgi:hypothetical protein
VNGIYTNQLGIYFQLIANNDLLFCLSSAPTNCGNMPNTDANSVLNNSPAFSTSRGVAETEYDIGHVFTT